MGINNFECGEPWIADFWRDANGSAAPQDEGSAHATECRRYNEDATQRADAQRLLSMTEETIRQQNRNTAGAQAVMGGTNASVAAAKAQNNNAIADAASRIAAAGEARKDRVEDSYRSRNQELDDQLTNLDNSKMSALSQATQAAGATLGSVGSSIDDWFDTRTGLPKDKVDKEKENTTA